MQRLVIASVLAFCAVPAFAEPGAGPPPMEYQQPTGRSGFWTSPYPAKNGAYRYRLLGIGGALLLATGLVTWRQVKKASAFRAKRDAAANETVET